VFRRLLILILFCPISIVVVMNKNFPAGLSIFHSSYPSAFRSTLDPSDRHVEVLSSVLSAEAQDRAIAKFGIAGRVWGLVHANSPLFRGRLTPTGNDTAGKQLMP
jgi:hypothetical protein